VAVPCAVKRYVELKHQVLTTVTKHESRFGRGAFHIHERFSLNACRLHIEHLVAKESTLVIQSGIYI
jgi:hypothetical protein